MKKNFLKEIRIKLNKIKRNIKNESTVINIMSSDINPYFETKKIFRIFCCKSKKEIFVPFSCLTRLLNLSKIDANEFLNFILSRHFLDEYFVDLDVFYRFKDFDINRKNSINLCNIFHYYVPEIHKLTLLKIKKYISRVLENDFECSDSLLAKTMKSGNGLSFAHVIFLIIVFKDTSLGISKKYNKILKKKIEIFFNVFINATKNYKKSKVKRFYKKLIELHKFLLDKKEIYGSNVYFNFVFESISALKKCLKQSK